MPSLLIPSPASSRADPALGEDQDAVADFGELLGVGTGADHGHALGGRLPDRREDLLSGADVNALRRFVEQEQQRRAVHPSRNQHLLRIASGKRRELEPRIVGLDLEPRAQLARFALHRTVLHPAGRERSGSRPAGRCCRRSAGCRPRWLPADRPATSAKPRSMALARSEIGDRDGFVGEGDDAGPARPRAEQQIGDLLVTRADQPGEPEDFAPSRSSGWTTPACVLPGSRRERRGRLRRTPASVVVDARDCGRRSS